MNPIDRLAREDAEEAARAVCRRTALGVIEVPLQQPLANGQTKAYLHYPLDIARQQPWPLVAEIYP